MPGKLWSAAVCQLSCWTIEKLIQLSVDQFLNCSLNKLHTSVFHPFLPLCTALLTLCTVTLHCVADMWPLGWKPYSALVYSDVAGLVDRLTAQAVFKWPQYVTTCYPWESVLKISDETYLPNQFLQICLSTYLGYIMATIISTHLILCHFFGLD